MRVQLNAVAKAEREHALPVTSVLFETGRSTFGFAETEQRPTVLGLLASGRMHADTGEVLIDGRADPAALRRRVALVDAPDISAPEPNVAVVAVVAEELMFAGHRSGPVSARRWLKEQSMSEVAGRPFSNLEPPQRLRLLCELAALRKGVEGLVLVSPDRHGGDPRVWWGLADEFAGRGMAVLVIAGEASRLVLGAELGTPDEPAADEDQSLPSAKRTT
ncbi:hypothetical protein NQ152_14995 [Microbacterium sp. zg.B48]|uniref:hypothetical protein n=1 Tax=unclassified Microbacterium TaxID=2609290 RepID=UPI00214AA89B|nr:MULTISPECIES: hypothetical protein [unclassified Microbacterium]MCR2764818.1 hypothetical protein [Microbacterium sp. zg.B48]MCR2810044.1 hypothetical protein [Microbacterium sp. zg.B185]WIM20116.1 hypothetical protein QNO12_04725 [Microbacterium sp. zg-B185]